MLNQQLVNVYTDGSYSNQKRIGAWAFLIKYGAESFTNGHGVEPTARSSNEMELVAVVQALQRLRVGYKVILHTDSTYVLAVLKGKIEPRQDRHLVDAFHFLCSFKELEVSLEHVPGHSGHKGNVHCDIMARKLVRAYKM